MPLRKILAIWVPLVLLHAAILQYAQLPPVTSVLWSRGELIDLPFEVSRWWDLLLFPIGFAEWELCMAIKKKCPEDSLVPIFGVFFSLGINVFFCLVALTPHVKTPVSYGILLISVASLFVLAGGTLLKDIRSAFAVSLVCCLVVSLIWGLVGGIACFVFVNMSPFFLLLIIFYSRLFLISKKRLWEKSRARETVLRFRENMESKWNERRELKQLIDETRALHVTPTVKRKVLEAVRQVPELHAQTKKAKALLKEVEAECELVISNLKEAKALVKRAAGDGFYKNEAEEFVKSLTTEKEELEKLLVEYARVVSEKERQATELRNRIAAAREESKLCEKLMDISESSADAVARFKTLLPKLMGTR